MFVCLCVSLNHLSLLLKLASRSWPYWWAACTMRRCQAPEMGFVSLHQADLIWRHFGDHSFSLSVVSLVFIQLGNRWKPILSSLFWLRVALVGYNCVHNGLTVSEQKDVFLKTEPLGAGFNASEKQTRADPCLQLRENKQ